MDVDADYIGFALSQNEKPKRIIATPKPLILFTDWIESREKKKSEEREREREKQRKQPIETFCSHLNKIILRSGDYGAMGCEAKPSLV